MNRAIPEIKRRVTVDVKAKQASSMYKKILKLNRNMTLGARPESMDMFSDLQGRNTNMSIPKQAQLSNISQFDELKETMNQSYLTTQKPNLISPPKAKQKKSDPIIIQKMDEYCRDKNVFFNDDDRIKFQIAQSKNHFISVESG